MFTHMFFFLHLELSGKVDDHYDHDHSILQVKKLRHRQVRKFAIILEV